MEKAKEIIKEKKKKQKGKKKKVNCSRNFWCQLKSTRPTEWRWVPLSLSPARHSLLFSFLFDWNLNLNLNLIFFCCCCCWKILELKSRIVVGFYFCLFIEFFFFGCLLHHSVSRCASRSVFRGFRCTLFEGCWYLRWDPCWDPFGILEGGGPGVWV